MKPLSALAPITMLSPSRARAEFPPGRGMRDLRDREEIATHAGDDAAPGPMALALELATSEQPSSAAMEWLQAGLAIWLRTEGLSMERCLRLPTTTAKRRQMLRNLWLAEALARIDRRGLWARCVALASEWETFVTRGAWLVWRMRSDPPSDASALRRALFYATKANDDRALSTQQIWRAIEPLHI
jgi:hypothetical protein